MVRYKIRMEGGVFDSDNGNAIVKKDKSSPAWIGYIAWLKAGNSPDPADQALPFAPGRKPAS